MILEKVKKPSAFLDFFQEADDDETPKRNQKVIKVRAPGGRRTDFTQGSDLSDDGGDEEQTPEEPATDDTDFTDDAGDNDTAEADEPATDDTDFTDDGGEDSGSDDGGETIDAGSDSGEDPTGEGEGLDEPATDDTDFTDDSGEDAGTDDGGDEPVTDDTDFSDDSGDGDSSDDGEDSSTDDSTDDSGGEKPSDEQIRKYSLYKKFTRLNETLEGICDSLSSVMSDNSEINQKYKTVAQKLKELNQLLSEYMILKFASASYIQSMLFYQRSLAIIDINLNILKDLKKESAKTKNMNK